MRLVDADALNKELQQRVGSPTEDKLYEVNLCIIDAPTIDAIPVEWLIKRRDIYLKSYHAGHECDLHTAAILNDLIKDWRKEQKA